MSALVVPNDFTNGELAFSAQMNVNFTACAAVINGELDTTNFTALAAITGSQLAASAGITNAQLVNGNSLFPYGSVVAWWAVDSTIPTGWALCNGQTATWLTGPHATDSIVLPNLIGMFIEGSDITSGVSPGNASGYGSQANQSIFGATAHTHTYADTTALNAADQLCLGAVGVQAARNFHTHTQSGTTSSVDLEPPCYAMVYIMKL
jgi:hypothetical protein